MDAIIEYLESILPAGFDAANYLKTVLLFMAASLVLGFLGRMLFGKKSALNQSLSAVIGILFIYAVTIVIHSCGLDLQFLLSPLPFISLEGDYLRLFAFTGKDYTIICDQVLSMVILAFLVNIIDRWFSKTKNIFAWLFFRCVSVVGAMLVHVGAHYLLNLFLPEGLLLWAPVILLTLLVLMLAVGALKFLIGALLSTTVSPVIGLIYTFFFSTVVGKLLTRAMLTTLILSGLVAGLNSLGVTTIFIGASALLAYLPFMLILLAVWYLIGHVL